jgi:hypothetical protein
MVYRKERLAWGGKLATTSRGGNYSIIMRGGTSASGDAIHTLVCTDDGDAVLYFIEVTITQGESEMGSPTSGITPPEHLE